MAKYSFYVYTGCNLEALQGFDPKVGNVGRGNSERGVIQDTPNNKLQTSTTNTFSAKVK